MTTNKSKHEPAHSYVLCINLASEIQLLCKRDRMVQGNRCLSSFCLGTKDNSVIRSKDAYMLIYARRVSRTRKLKLESETDLKSAVPAPPPWALKAVESLNRTHSQTCDEFSQKYVTLLPTLAKVNQWCPIRKLSLVRHFEKVRTDLRSIYRSWNLSNRGEVCSSVSQFYCD